MVAQDAEPRLVGQAGPLIDAFEDLIELVLRRVRDLIHRTPTCLLNSAPIKVVTYVEDILWVDECSAGFKGIGYQKLRLIIYACHIATLWGTWSLAAGVKAFHELLMIAELHLGGPLKPLTNISKYRVLLTPIRENIIYPKGLPRHSVHLIPAAPGEDARTGPASPIVSNDGLPALRWV